ncbi:sigma factor-like helix-turn-helix DNA-binding protein [Streptomyces sp. DSM 41982]|uniref:Sigma factor-like helix-turn-helix DNA-binding protein n=1 Tax=Streptomyces evansiae TaxID=3075535 RepID=A0ABD5E0V6_9ACTN|nr:MULTISPECIES: sigma factor-like helix-turn-helix DNA-binding protein [unclassified Streptomyces]MDT0414714.1 sigma factor-like helix-turn-helix DNA-binding protein [Streptomyces sp. DSM 41982]SCE19707.1 RNA polymerase sigma factor, sigma-70 family [Streptomyces sp. SolWspMP-sol7th]
MNESDRMVRGLRVTFDAFCETHERAWSGFALARLREEGMAREVVARTRERVQLRWSWLMRQAVPALHAWGFLKEEIVAALAEHQVSADTAPAPDWVESVRGATVRALDLAESHGSHEELYAAIRRLSERRHDVIVLRYVLNLPDADIADYLNTTETTVRSTASQALNRLARILDGRQGEM